MAFMLMLTSMTLTMMQGNNVFGRESNKQAARLNFVSHDLDFENIYIVDHLGFFSMLFAEDLLRRRSHEENLGILK